VFEWLLMSVVAVPVLLGLVAATGRRSRGALLWMIALVLLYDLFYLCLLYYLRHRWVG
jgi:hypothetical protein